MDRTAIRVQFRLTIWLAERFTYFCVRDFDVFHGRRILALFLIDAFDVKSLVKVSGVRRTRVDLIDAENTRDQFRYGRMVYHAAQHVARFDERSDQKT